MNLPNKLTVLRVLMVPFFVFFALADFIPHHNLIAGLIFGAASYTDHLDGKIACFVGRVAQLGQLTANRLLIQGRADGCIGDEIKIHRIHRYLCSH